jgi:hypothetical protein
MNRLETPSKPTWMDFQMSQWQQKVFHRGRKCNVQENIGDVAFCRKPIPNREFDSREETRER